MEELNQTTEDKSSKAVSNQKSTSQDVGITPLVDNSLETQEVEALQDSIENSTEFLEMQQWQKIQSKVGIKII